MLIRKKYTIKNLCYYLWKKNPQFLSLSHSLPHCNFFCLYKFHELLWPTSPVSLYLPNHNFLCSSKPVDTLGYLNLHQNHAFDFHIIFSCLTFYFVLTVVFSHMNGVLVYYSTCNIAFSLGSMKSNKWNSCLLLRHLHGVTDHIYSNNFCDPILGWHISIRTILISCLDYIYIKRLKALLIKLFCSWIYEYGLDLERMDKFLETYHLLQLDHEITENLNRSITTKEITSVIKNFPTNLSSGPESYSMANYTSGRQINTNISQILPKKKKIGVKHLQTHFTESALLPWYQKPDKDYIRKLQANNLDEHRSKNPP